MEHSDKILYGQKKKTKHTDLVGRYRGFYESNIVGLYLMEEIKPKAGKNNIR